MYSLKEYVVKSSVCEIKYSIMQMSKILFGLKFSIVRKKNVLKKITVKIRPFYSIENMFY